MLRLGLCFERRSESNIARKGMRFRDTENDQKQKREIEECKSRGEIERKRRRRQGSMKKNKGRW